MTTRTRTPKSASAAAAPTPAENVVDADTDLPAEHAGVWARLAKPFADDEVELLPKPFSRDSAKGNCDEHQKDRNGIHCGGYHGLPAVHLTYVGHAGITTRLNEVVGPDGWSWEPLHVQPPAWVEPIVQSLIAAGHPDKAMALIKEHGQPVQRDGGMWITLTVNGVTKTAFGDAGGKTGPNATKELIGDAIRNGAMRFGVGTYLWSKSDKAKGLAARHGADDDEQQPRGPLPEQVQAAIAQAYTSPNPARRLRAVGMGYGRDTLVSMLVVDPDGNKVFAADLIDTLIEKVEAIEAQEKASEPDPAPADQTTEQTNTAGEEQTQHPAQAAANEAQATHEQQRQAPTDLRFTRLHSEIRGQADALGIPPKQHTAPLIAETPGAALIADVPIVRLTRWTLEQRPAVIAALRAQGKAGAAETYERAGQALAEWHQLVGAEVPA